jgi:hypothetical protein
MAGQDRALIGKVCAAVRLTCEITFSLNVFGLSALMGDELAPHWMEIWKKWLVWHNDAAGSLDAEAESPEFAPQHFLYPVRRAIGTWLCFTCTLVLRIRSAFLLDCPQRFVSDQ